MNYEIVELKEKKIVGLNARINQKDPASQKTIGDLWQKIMTDGIEKTIKNRANEYAVGLYSNYDFEEMSCDVTVGCEISENANPELSEKTILCGRYARFNVRGDVVKDVAQAWMDIWGMPLDRSFAGDFEEYVSVKDGVAEVYIYIALKAE